MLESANTAAQGINMADIEANIQANIQAKMESGASKEEIMASMGQDEIQMSQAAPAVKPITKAMFKPKAHVSLAPVAVAAPAPVAPAASLAPSNAQVNAAEAQASQEKVKQMAQMLGIPFTADLIALGSNSAISDALIEKAVAAGKTEAQINAAMAQL